MRNRSRPRVATPATHKPAGIGHNGGPDAEAMRLFKLLGPRTIDFIRPFQCGAKWTNHANDVELQRLAKLELRIQLKTLALKELRTERKQIMDRCIRRMRRAGGKN